MVSAILLIFYIFIFFFNRFSTSRAFATRSISRHLASRYLAGHFYMQLLIFFRELTRQNREFSHDFCPPFASYAINIYT